jgi:hypothetical protein
VELSGSDIALVTTGVTTTSTTTTSTATTTRTTTRTRTNIEVRELAFRGLDAEVGAKLPLPAIAWSQDVRFFVGGYYFDHDAAETAIAGPRVRLEWRIDEPFGIWRGSRLTFESSYQWDEVRRDQIEVGARLRLPFGSENRRGNEPVLSAQERRMTERLERDANIISQPKVKTSISTSTSATTFDPVVARTSSTAQSTTTTREAVADALTDVRFDRAIIVANGQDLQAALTSSGSNSLIVAQGGATDFGRIFLVASQTLLGGGTTIQVKGITSGLLADFTAPGSRPTISYPGPSTSVVGGSAVVTLTSNTHLAGVNITGIGNVHTPNNHGVYGGDNNTNVVVNGVHVSNVGDQGIQFGSNNTNIRVINNTITNIPSDGINFQFNNSNVLISGNTVNGVGDGIVIQGNNTAVRVVDNHLSNIGDDAIGGMGGNQIEYSRNVFSGTITQNLLDIFSSNGNSYTGSGNVLAAGLVVGGRLCEASPAPAFTGSISFTNGTVFVDNVAPCN